MIQKTKYNKKTLNSNQSYYINKKKIYKDNQKYLKKLNNVINKIIQVKIQQKQAHCLHQIN